MEFLKMLFVTALKEIEAKREDVYLVQHRRKYL